MPLREQVTNETQTHQKSRKIRDKLTSLIFFLTAAWDILARVEPIRLSPPGLQSMIPVIVKPFTGEIFSIYGKHFSEKRISSLHQSLAETSFFHGAATGSDSFAAGEFFDQTYQKQRNHFRTDDPADSFGFVVEGLVRLQRTNPRDQRVVMDFVGPGGQIGGLLMSQADMVYPITAQAVGPGLFLIIPKTTYLKHWL